MLAETQFANLHIAAYRSGKYPERNYAPTQAVITKHLVQKLLHFIPILRWHTLTTTNL